MCYPDPGPGLHPLESRAGPALTWGKIPKPKSQRRCKNQDAGPLGSGWGLLRGQVFFGP